MSNIRATEKKNYNSTWSQEINPFRLENIEDIQLKHDMEQCRTDVNVDKLTTEQRKNNLR